MNTLINIAQSTHYNQIEQTLLCPNVKNTFQQSKKLGFQPCNLNKLQIPEPQKTQSEGSEIGSTESTANNLNNFKFSEGAIFMDKKNQTKLSDGFNTSKFLKFCNKNFSAVEVKLENSEENLNDEVKIENFEEFQKDELKIENLEEVQKHELKIENFEEFQKDFGSNLKFNFSKENTHKNICMLCQRELNELEPFLQITDKQNIKFPIFYNDNDHFGGIFNNINGNQLTNENILNDQNFQNLQLNFESLQNMDQTKKRSSADQILDTVKNVSNKNDSLFDIDSFFNENHNNLSEAKKQQENLMKVANNSNYSNELYLLLSLHLRF